MNGNHPPHDENEIAQLKRTIAALLSYNEALQQQLAAFKSGKALPHFSLSASQMGSGQTEASLSTSEIGSGQTEVSLSTSEMRSGQTEASSSTSQMGSGQTEVSLSTSQMGSGQTEASSSTSQMRSGQTDAPKTLPLLVEPDDKNVMRLYSKLGHANWRSLKRSGRKNASKLLIHFYNRGSGAHPQLMKLTGLSAGGIGKFLATLKRRGLIQRTAYQTFRLTASGLQLLTEALGQ